MAVPNARMLAAVFVSLVFVPVGAAQAVEAPACKQAPETCDARLANDGEVRRYDQPVRTILFGHFMDLLQQAPLNLQRPLDANPDLNDGFLLPSVVTGTDTEADVKFRNNRFVMFSSPGLVEAREQGLSVWQDARLGYDAYLDGSTVTGYWYMSADAVPPGAADVESPPGAMALVGVYMRMETGRAFGSGDLLAEGDTGTGYDGLSPENVAGTVTMFNVPGEDTVYEFEVPMTVRNPTLPGGPESDGFIVTVIPYQASSGQGTEVTTADWRVRTGAEYPPRILMDIIRPMKTVESSAYSKDGRLFVDWSFKSLLGSYDFNLASLSMEIMGPHNVGSDKLMLTRIEHRLSHGEPVSPVRVVWAYDFRANPLPDGVYSIQGSVKNLDRTYQLDLLSGFVVEEERPQVTALDAVLEGGTSTPAPGAAIGLLVLAVAALLGHRRLGRR